MKYFIFFSFALTLSFFSCKKNKEPIDESNISWYTNEDCWSNPDPDFLYRDSTIRAKLVEVGGNKELHISWPWAYTEITVTYTGEGNYSTDDTDLYIVRKVYDGLSTLHYRSNYSECSTCGGYMEILSDDGEYIEGNIRYFLGTYSVGSMSDVYSGLDCADFKIKWGK